MTYRRLFFLVTALFFAGTAFGQTKIIERLKQSVNQAKTPAQKLQALLLLCEERQSLHTDSLFAYASQAKKLALQQNDSRSMALAEYEIAFCFSKGNKADSALHLVNNALIKFKNKPKDKDLYLKFAMLKTRVMARNNQHIETLNELFKVLKEAESAKDTITQITAKTGIGWMQLERRQYREALGWFQNALHTSADPRLLRNYGAVYSNIALAYNAIGKNDSAEIFIRKAIELCRQSETLTFLATALNIQANIFINTNRESKAEVLLKEALAIRKNINDPYYILPDMTQLALFYAKTKQPEKGIKLCIDGISSYKNERLIMQMPALYHALAENYKAAGNFKMYGETLETLLSLNDSVYTTTSAVALAEMQAKYDVQKKENLIILQKLDLSRKNYLLYGSVIFLLLAAVIAWLLFSAYKKNQRLQMHKMQEEEKLKAARAVMLAEENERKRIAADLHDNMGAYASAISANVDDLMRGNNNDNETIIRSMKSNAADIMANLRDTIWVLNKESILLTGVSDRFKNYVQKFRDSYPNISIEFNENIVNDQTLSPQNALNMLRIMQEAFHNAIKHSNGSKINIQLASDREIEVIIADNGAGIDKAKHTIGNGFANMMARAKANGWQLEIRDLQYGTAVELKS